MYRISYNQSLRFVENEKKIYANIDEVSSTHLEVLFEDAYFDRDEIQIKLQTIINSFIENKKQIFHVKYFDNLSFRQISEIRYISESTLKSTYYAAIKIIEEKIGLKYIF
jgi:RNA polymerase sigma-70 factor (ECF subfamily)